MTFQSKTAVVFGGGGFIGSHLIDALVAEGADVTAVDRFSAFGTKNLDHLKGSISLVDCDIAADDLSRIGKDVNYIFHFAAMAAPPECEKNMEAAFKTNVYGTLKVLRYAQAAGVDKLVFPSSALLYGRNPKYFPIDERHPVEANENVYNATKKMGEELCTFFREKNGVPVVFLRLFNCFGPRQTGEYFIPTVIKQALEKGTIEIWNGKPLRDFTFVTDAVSALMLSARSDYCGGPINIGSGREIATSDIARMIAKRLGAKISFQDREVMGSMRLCCDNKLARSVLGWKPKTAFEDGLDRTIEWFKADKAR